MNYPDELLYHFTAKVKDDSANTDLSLVCDICNQTICDVEHGDSLAALASTAAHHMAELHPHELPDLTVALEEERR